VHYNYRLQEARLSPRDPRDALCQLKYSQLLYQ